MTERDSRVKNRPGMSLKISRKSDRLNRRVVQNDLTISSVNNVSRLNLSERTTPRTARHNFCKVLRLKAYQPSEKLFSSKTMPAGLHLSKNAGTARSRSGRK